MGKVDVIAQARERLSVLIASYKNVSVLETCLASLVETFQGTLPEVVLVDDAAGDPETRALAERWADKGVKFFVMPANGGFAGANNFGWPHCTKEIVALINTDIVFRENPFPALLDFFDAHPKAGICQGTLLVKNGEPGVDGTLNGCGAFLTPLGTTVSPEWLKPADVPAARVAKRCFAAAGAFFLLRRRVVDSLGGRLFYSFFHSYYEEVDLCHRAALAGWEIWYVPTPPVDHAHSSTFAKYVPRETVLRRFYRNVRFSHRTCFGPRGRWMIISVFELCCWAQTVVQLLKGKGMAWRAHRWARREIRRLAPEIKSARRQVQELRKVSDAELFKTAMRHYSLREFVNLIRGNT